MPRAPRRSSVNDSATASEKAVAIALLPWFVLTARDLPWRRTQDPYAIWISEIMLQQTQVKTVIPYWQRWMEAFPTVEALASARSDRVLKLWEGLGYYSRARNIHRAAVEIRDQHDARFPTDHATVLELPGIGPYTAGAICSIAYNQPAPILDGNVIRVLCRVWAVPGDPRSGKTNALLWDLATRLVKATQLFPPQHAPALAGNCSALNQAFMELGALVCTPRDPACSSCPLQAVCKAHRTRRVARYPRAVKRVKATPRRFQVFVVQSGDGVWVGRRVDGGANAGLWEFPGVELAEGMPSEPAEDFLRWAGIRPTGLDALLEVKHSITRFRILTMGHRVHLALTLRTRLEGAQILLGWSEARWVNGETLEALPLSAAHSRIRAAWREACVGPDGRKGRQDPIQTRFRG